MYTVSLQLTPQADKRVLATVSPEPKDSWGDVTRKVREEMERQAKQYLRSPRFVPDNSVFVGHYAEDGPRRVFAS